MPNKLKVYEKEGKKTYTLKSEISGKETKSAHYKFIKLPTQTRTKSTTE